MCGGGDFWGPVASVLQKVVPAAFTVASGGLGAGAATIGTTLGDVGLDAGALTGAVVSQL